MDSFIYYTQQSPFTDPGEYIGLFDDLPHDTAGLCQVVRGLIIHYFADASILNCTIPKARLSEVDTRYTTKMLARIVELDNRPLTAARPPEKRLVGCCRDFATLFCAMARHRDIATRTRVGFSNYFIPNFHVDHEIAEYWDAKEQRWRLVDPQINSDLHLNTYHITFDPLDVPHSQFMVGGQAWQMCRAGKADPNTFGLSPDSDLKGWWFIRTRLMHDLARQNKMELLLWDAWGLMEKEPTEEDLKRLDSVAELTQAGNRSFADIRAIYEHEAALKVPPVVKSYSPAAATSEITLVI
jgi:hypothetical protein